MQLPQWLARFNRYVTNPVQRLWAGYAPGMGILEHVGRKSRKPYVLAFGDIRTVRIGTRSPRYEVAVRTQ
jgi:hypothetical protein